MPTTRVFSTPPVVNPLAWCPTITTLCKSHPQLYSGWYFKIKRSFFLLSSDWHGCTRMLKRFSSVILISWKWDASGGNSMPWVTLWTPCALVLRRSQVSASDIPIQKYSQYKKKAKYYLCVTPHVLTHFSVCPDIVIPFYYMVCTTCHERVVCSDDAGQNICLVSCFCSGLHGCYFVNSQKTDPKNRLSGWGWSSVHSRRWMIGRRACQHSHGEACGRTSRDTHSHSCEVPMNIQKENWLIMREKLHNRIFAPNCSHLIVICDDMPRKRYSSVFLLTSEINVFFLLSLFYYSVFFPLGASQDQFIRATIV